MSIKTTIIVAIIIGTVASNGQLIIQQPGAPVAFGIPTQQQSLAHRDVLLNAQMEEQLTPEQHRSTKYYSNPAIAQELAKESWLTNKEMPVFDRAADHIDRSQIYKIVKSAGFINRR
ncbi:uncharacterized protein LOC123291920 [Chrysoperla carnea]|uniref:uncharacterized protein LOC123291920 n=1 Tax=Chrysoperla carnea TaxID=189513 RepID=UPI001D075633|nr:uncharacterized protein LOC123291920 [Chrysoperla carnea]